MTNNEIALQKATMEWMLQKADSYTHALTLTLKPYRTVLTERGEIREALTKDNASANMRHFINRLNASLYGNAAKRYGKSITILATVEGEATNKLLHYHCAIGNLPDTLNEQTIHCKIKAAWEQTNFGNQQVNIQRMQTSGWLGYMSKEVGLHNTDVVDWENVR